MITWKMVLSQASKLTPEISAKNVAEIFSFPLQEAQRRLELLRTWGYLRHAHPEKKTRRGYLLTSSGEKLLLQWRTNSTDLTQGTELHGRCKECTREDWRKRSEQE